VPDRLFSVRRAFPGDTGAVRRRWVVAGALAMGCTGAVLEGTARASSVLEFPDNGSEQLGRGGAWVARASDPLAAFYNPAGLAGQPTRFLLNANVIVSHTCFTRIKSNIDQQQEPAATDGVHFPRVCNDIAPFLNPQLAMTYQINERMGAGFAFLGPSANGESNFPTFVNTANGPQPSPQRYMEVYSNAFVVTPTFAFGAEVVDNLRLGASFQWGIAKAKFVNSTLAINGDNQSAGANDIQSTLIVHDYFVPGFTVGGIYTIADSLDIAGWYKWSDTIKASGDVYSQTPFYTKDVANGKTSGIYDGDTSQRDCGYGAGTTVCGNGDNAKVKLTIPMEAKIGVRYHRPRSAEPRKHHRDPLADDVFDAEVDLTWSNNSAFDAIQVRFPGDANGNGIIPVNGAAGGAVPPNDDVRHHFKDVIGVRAGGDYNVIPDQLALRGGAFFESNGQDPTYQNIDYAGASRFGLAGGATFRVRLDREKTNALEFSLGFMHVFFAKQENNDPTAVGLRAIAGTTCNPESASQPGATCTNGTQKYRTNWPINLGTITNSINVINIGANYRF